ncbi:cyclin [Cryptosporidium canis]|uniref:Cyclin n=1 Tax=Cryptosporidium canis TaxID=195482 RepID=A0ABQ8PBA6_9CRYT|nr:cyclin [Cryptosporidium canis]
MKGVLTMMNEYAYNFLFPLNSVGSSGTFVSNKVNNRHGNCNSSNDALTNLRKSEVCTYKSILKSNENLNNCDYFRSLIHQPGDSRNGICDTQTTTGLARSIIDEMNAEPGSTNTEPGFIVALSLFLTQIATSNSSNTSYNVGVLTPFHSVCIPPIPIRAYLIRLAQNFGCSNECFVLAIIYVGRMIKYNRNFTVTLLNVHRVIVTALILATKFFDDIYYSNAFYAKVSGVGTRELNSLEIHFLRLIRFQLFVTEHEYEIYKRFITKSAVPHSAITSPPINIFKHPSDEMGSDVQPKDHNLTGERKRLPLLNSSPYNYNYSTVYNSLSHGKKIENRDIQSILIGEFSVNSRPNFTNGLFTQFNPVYGSNTDNYTDNRFCSKLQYEVNTNSDSASFPQFTQNSSINLSEQWVSQYSFNLNSIHAQTPMELGNANMPHESMKDDLFSHRVHSNRSISGSNVGNDFFSETSSYGYGNGQIDDSNYTQNEYFKYSDSSKAEIQSSNISHRRYQQQDTHVCDMHQDNKSAITSTYASEVGFYGYTNSSDYNTLSTTDAIQSTAVTLVNPAVNHYGRSIFMNPSNIRCTTGMDRGLLV